MKRLALSVAISTVLVLSACGGSGGSSSSSSQSAAKAISGVAAKGVIQQGIVTAYELVAGNWVSRGSATTDESGQYTLNLTDYQNGIVKLVLSAGSNTRMKCDVADCDGASFGQSVALGSDFALDAVLPNLTSTSNIPITPYTHMAAAMIESQLAADPTTVTAEAVTSALSKVSTLAGFDVAATKVIDITDATQLAAASDDEKMAAVRGAAIMELTSEQLPIAAVLKSLASSFADGAFSANDSISITALANAFDAVMAESELTANLGETVKTALQASVAQIKGQIGSDGSYTPVANPNVSLSAEAQGKALIRDTRSFIYNIINQADSGKFDQPLEALGVHIDDAAEVFNRDTAAMTEILGLGIEQMQEALSNDDTLRATLQANGSASKQVTVTSNGKTLGTLTLTASNYNAVKMSLKGTLQGEQSNGRSVVVDLQAQTNVDLKLLSDDGSSSSQTILNMVLNGTLSDGSTSLNIDSNTLATLSVGFDSKADNLGKVVTSVKLDELVAHIVSAGATFDGSLGFELIRPSGTTSSYLYEDTANLTLKSVALDGTFVTAQKESMQAAIELNLLNSDTFDLLAFLNGEDELDIRQDEALSDSQVAAIQNASQVKSVSGWNINYGINSYNGSKSFANSTDWDGWKNYAESYNQLAAIYDPVAALKSQFASLPGAEVRYAEVNLASYGLRQLNGNVYLPEYAESGSNFLKAQLTTSLALSNVTGLPEAKVWARINRDSLNGGSATLQVSWRDAAQNVSYQFRFDGVDVKAKTGNLTISNPYGVKAVFDKVNLTEGSTSGAVYVAGNKVGDITTLDNGLVKIKYTDGSFETLQ
ncbi:MAG: hypothetical protein KAY06_10495 [Aeromonadaceae bacterium]|nr:hypothetical protein [Aeromonadaceae bacterium]